MIENCLNINSQIKATTTTTTNNHPEQFRMTRSPFYRINAILVSGVVFAAVALTSHFLVPILLEKLILQNIVLDPTSSSYSSWQKTDIPIYHRIYLFNVTNVDRIFSHGEKPVIQQIGPYTFMNSLEKVDISWNNENGTVQYRQLKRWYFVPSMTNASLDDEIVNVNVPLMSAIGAIDMAPNEDERFMQTASLNSFVEQFKFPTFVRKKARSLLFEGYDDDLLKIASNFYPKRNLPTKFGWFFGRNGTATGGQVRIFTGKYNSGKKLGLVDTWNDESYNKIWSSGSKCRSFEHTSGGDLQPPFFVLNNYRFLNYLKSSDKINDFVRIFIADMCRSFELRYKHPIRHNGIDAYRYHAGSDIFNYSIDSNRCFCQKRSCPPNGLFWIGPCQQNAPIYISHPHFLYGDASLLNKVDGLHPNQNDHQFLMDLDKHLAIPINVDIRLQINLFIKKNEEIDFMEFWPDQLDNIYLPQLWTSTSANIDKETTTKLSFLFNKLPVILFGMTIVFAAICLMLLCSVIIYAISNKLFVNFGSIKKYDSVCVMEAETNASNRDECDMKEML